MDFKSFNLNPRIAAGVEAAGFTEPTPIQAQSIPKIMQHCDVMGLAQISPRPAQEKQRPSACRSFIN
jgi:superfamily II DNA/RNA helicase